MPGGFSLFPDMAAGQSAGLVLSVLGGGTQVQGGTGAANTKGSWVQLVASSTYDATWMRVNLAGDNSINVNCNHMLIDIGVGAAASEVVIAPNLHFNSFAGNQFQSYIFPVCIPAGTRIAARCQADATSLNSCIVGVNLFDGGFTQVESAGLNDIGTNTGNSQMTAMTPGASGVKGSYAQLVASSSRDYAGLLVAVPYQSSSSNESISVDIGVGAGGSEQIIIPDVLTFMHFGDAYGTTSYPIFTPIPAGTRIAARASSHLASPTAGTQIAVYGIIQ